MIKIEDLVERTRNGDKDAYCELINLVKTDLVRVANKKMHNEDDAQDVIQETIIKAYLNIDRLHKNSNFRAWIIKILINECNDFYRKKQKNDATIDKVKSNFRTTSYLDEYDIHFENLIDSLKDNEKEIFSLRYKFGLTSKEIANKLSMNENSVRSILSRGMIKLRKLYKSTSMLIAILVLFTAISVTAFCVVNYVIEQFKVNDTSMKNDGVLMAIEHMEYYQETNMDYIDLGDGYNFKVDYLLMDEMNLYMVVDLKSEKDISKFTDMYIPDLKITDDNGNVICDVSDMFAEQYSKKTAFKLIESSATHIKALIFMYADSFPISKSLNIQFTEILVNQDLHNTCSINNNSNFEIELDDKFINRHSTMYTSNDTRTEKAIITETGFYTIVNDNDFDNSNIKLIDEFNNTYKCYYDIFTTDSYETKYIIIANFNNTNCSNLKLIIGNKEYQLTKN